MRFTILLLGAALLSSQANAFDSKKFSINYFQETESTSMEMGNDGNTIVTFRQASFRYRVTDSWTGRIDLRDETTDRIVDESADKNGDTHVRVDPRIGIQAVVWKSGKFSLFTQFLADVKADVNNNGTDKIMRPRVYNSLSIDLSDRQNLAFAVAVRRWLYQPNKDDQETLQMDGFTEITYRLQLSDMTTFQAYYYTKLQSRKDYTSADLIQSGADLDLGFEWSFKDVGTFMPYVGIDLQNADDTYDQEYADLSLGFWLSTNFF